MLLTNAFQSGGYGDSAPSAPHPAGSPEAEFERMFREYRNGLLSFLSHTLRNREDAEDGLTQTFIKAWTNRERFRGETSEKRWLYRIAHCVAIDAIRTRRTPPTESLDALGELMLEAGCAPNPADLMTDAEKRSEARSLLAGLQPEQRLLMELHYLDSLTYEEISVVLGIPATKVKGRLHRIRRTLQRDLSRSGTASRSKVG